MTTITELCGQRGFFEYVERNVQDSIGYGMSSSQKKRFCSKLFKLGTGNQSSFSNSSCVDEAKTGGKTNAYSVMADKTILRDVGSEKTNSVSLYRASKQKKKNRKEKEEDEEEDGTPYFLIRDCHNNYSVTDEEMPYNKVTVDPDD